MRVFELARELGRPSKEIITILNGLGVLVTSHASVIDEATAEKVKQYYIQRGLVITSEHETPPEEEKVSAPPAAEEVTPVEETAPAETVPVEEVAEAAASPPEESPPVEAVPAPDEPVVPEPVSAPEPTPVSEPTLPPSPPAAAEPVSKPEPPPKEPAAPRRPPRERRARPYRGPMDRRRRKRHFREELRHVTERRDYVSMRERSTERTGPRRGARLSEWTARAQGEPSARAPHAPFVPPPKPERRKGKGRPEPVVEREEREKELTLPRKRDEFILPEPTEIREITIPEGLTVKELAQRLGVKPNIVIKALMQKGRLMTVNQVVPTDLAVEVAEMFGVIAQPVTLEEELLLEEAVEDHPEDRVSRPPVVTVMGHVDHGKTTLLDRIRKTNVAEQEIGGITQRIGAYQVEINGRRITFIDTPGHEAFTAMRARGAKATDIVILVVAADDGVMPQTIEAINHARAANTPIVVAINKIDKPNADVDRVKRELANVGLLVEEWGGDTVAVPISAKQGIGIQDLLEMVLLVADLLDLKANPKVPARGIILESRLDPKRGPIATVLVQNGMLKVGQVFVAGATWGRVRAMFNDRGQRVEEALPSMPVEVLGFVDVPQAGDIFQVVQSEQKARQIAQLRREKIEEQMRRARRFRLEDLSARLKRGEVQELPIILKADTQGSLEALRQALQELDVEEVKVHIIHAGVGGVTASDVLLAAASNAIILGFNVRPDARARQQAEQENVEMRFYGVIYDIIEDIRAAMQGMLKPRVEERILGVAEVRQTFRIKGVGVVAGCFVQQGKVVRGARARLIRDQVVIYDGTIASLKRFKDDVREVAQGYECGLTLANFQDIKVGDLIEVYTLEEVAPTTVATAQSAQQPAG